MMDISSYLKAGYPAIHIISEEIDRLTRSIVCPNWVIVQWDILRGITTQNNQPIDDIKDPLSAINWLSNKTDCVLLLHNFHAFLGSVEILQAIYNQLDNFKSNGNCLVIMSNGKKLPGEISRFFTNVNHELPSQKELEILLENMAMENGIEFNKNAAIAAKGLTEFEAETAFAYSLVKSKKFDPEIILEQKKTMVKSTGLMDFYQPVDINQVGGLGAFKSFLSARKPAFEPKSKLPRPKAILLVGIPGTGKSLSCKAAASILQWPLIRLDISALKGSLVGESEKNMRKATAIIDGFGQAVVWLDEIEKAFSGVKSSGQTDGGTTSSMFGHFLTWLNETAANVLIMATANDISQLPPEFLRAGRFDSIFFVDLPTTKEKHEIINIMNKKYNTDIDETKANLLDGFTGAEIEQLIKDSIFDGFDMALSNIVPLARSMKEQIDGLRNWATSRARLANTIEEKPNNNNSKTRKVKLVK